jgi:hypothetical protein
MAILIIKQSSLFEIASKRKIHHLLYENTALLEQLKILALRQQSPANKRRLSTLYR